MAYIASLKVHEGVKVFLYGESLGTGIAVAYLSQHPEAAHPSGSVRGLILLAPFTSLPAAALSHPIAAPFRLFPIVKEFMYVMISRLQRRVFCIIIALCQVEKFVLSISQY